MPRPWNFHSAGQIVFGHGCVKQLGGLIQRLDFQRVLVVTDPPLASGGVLGQVRASLAEAKLEVDVFQGGAPEPSLAIAEKCVGFAKHFRPDAFVGLGGGSNMDLAKFAATLMRFGGDPRQYFGEDRLPGPPFPVVCVPTTAGTGSEVSCAAVLTDEANQIKVSMLSNYLRPVLAVVDPLLTKSCPRKVTADSGIDALTHAIEAYTAIDNNEFPPASFPLAADGRSVYQGHNPLADILAQRAIVLIGENLVNAVQYPDDTGAREAMSLAALLAGLAFSNSGVALVHALEYPIGGATHCSHGAGNGLLLPHVMRFNMPTRKHRLSRVANLLGRSVQGLDDQAAAEQAIDAVAELARRSGIPARLRDLGVHESQLPTFAEKAFALKRLLRVNPRPATQSDLEEILRAAY